MNYFFKRNNFIEVNSELFVVEKSQIVQNTWENKGRNGCERRKVSRSLLNVMQTKSKWPAFSCWDRRMEPWASDSVPLIQVDVDRNTNSYQNGIVIDLRFSENPAVCWTYIQKWASLRGQIDQRRLIGKCGLLCLLQNALLVYLEPLELKFFGGTSERYNNKVTMYFNLIFVADLADGATWQEIPIRSVRSIPSKDRVITSSHNVCFFIRGLPRNNKHSCKFCRSQLVTARHSSSKLVTARQNSLATANPGLSYFSVNHSDILCKLYVWRGDNTAR